MRDVLALLFAAWNQRLMEREMTQLDNRKEPSQGPVGGSEAQEREALLEVGSTYLTRDGRMVTINAVSDARTAFYGRLPDGRVPSWHADGTTPPDSSGRTEYPSDLIYAVTPLRADRATAAAPAAPVRQDGQEPVAWMCEWKDGWLQFHHARDPLPKKWDDEVPRITPLYAAHPPAAVGQALEALELAKNGLAWYRDSFPGAADGSDYEAEEKIDAAIAALSVQAEVPAVVDAQDARRYRWLRNESAPTLDPADNGKPWCARVSGVGLQAYNEPLYGEDLDDAIDAAMRAADTKEGN